MYMYVLDNKGKRIICSHPGERRKVTQVLGNDVTLETVRERTGFNSFCLCLDCLHQFEADLGEVGWNPFQLYMSEPMPTSGPVRDKRECPECRSTEVKTELELVGETCPKCRKGIVEETWTGRVS